MRIALFTGNYNYIRDGANQAMNRLARYLDERGDSIRVYSPVNVVLEAMASGLAIVSADVPSAGQLIANDESGLLCGPDSYVDALKFLLGDPARRRALGVAARAASERYDWDSASASVASAYDAVLARRARLAGGRKCPARSPRSQGAR